MAVYEFKTAVSDGIIYIPAEYRNKFKGTVQVILVHEEIDDKEIPGKSQFPYFAVDTTNYVFNREEANER